MNLAAIVASAMHAVPTGIRGSVTFKRARTAGAYRPLTDTAAEPLRREFTVDDIVVLNVDPDSFAGRGLSVEKVRDILVPASLCLWAPQNGDSVMFGGREWQVLTVDPIQPDGVTDALYTIRVQYA